MEPRDIASCAAGGLGDETPENFQYFSHVNS